MSNLMTKKLIKQSKNILKKLKNKSKKNSKILKKTTLNKKSFKKCENFCKNDYLKEMIKRYKKNDPLIKLTKQDSVFLNNTCKKTFCNEKCQGYDFFGDKIKQQEFQKKIKNGFQSSYSPKKVEKLKKRGALSGCVDVSDDFDIFHK